MGIVRDSRRIYRDDGRVGAAVWETGYAYPPYVWYDSFTLFTLITTGIRERYGFARYRSSGRRLWFTVLWQCQRSRLIIREQEYSPRCCDLRYVWIARIAQAWGLGRDMRPDAAGSEHLPNRRDLRKARRRLVKTGHVTNYAKGTRTSDPHTESGTDHPKGPTDARRSQKARRKCLCPTATFTEAERRMAKMDQQRMERRWGEPKNLWVTVRVDNATKNQLDRDKANREKAAQRSRTLTDITQPSTTNVRRQLRGFGGGFGGGAETLVVGIGTLAETRQTSVYLIGLRYDGYNEFHSNTTRAI